MDALTYEGGEIKITTSADIKKRTLRVGERGYDVTLISTELDGDGSHVCGTVEAGESEDEPPLEEELCTNIRPCHHRLLCSHGLLSQSAFSTPHPPTFSQIAPINLPVWDYDFLYFSCLRG